MNKLEKIEGGLIGLIVGDALGVPYEFHPAAEIPSEDEIEFEPPHSFRRAHRGVPTGTYSDDSAQALILLNTLLECGKFDVEHFAKGLTNWYETGFMAVDGQVFDVGIQTSNAISELKKGVKPISAGGVDEYSNGNGSLMRVLPLVLWHRGSDDELVEIAETQSCVTHAHLRSRICCALYCLWARNLLNETGDEWNKAVEFLRNYYKNNADKIAQLEFDIRPNDEHKVGGSGYVVDSLFSAKLVCEKESFEKTVKAAIKLGNDTDTTACIAGGIAGIKYGVDAIPIRWRENLRGKELYEPLLEKLKSKVG
jgi:ADP-ribosyl-[dinitrogen reductase] hydrolase